MNLTKRQLNILTVSLTNFYDEVCKTGTTPEMKQDIMGLCKLVNDEYARDVIAEKYPNRKVIAVISRKTPDELAQGHSKVP